MTFEEWAAMQTGLLFTFIFAILIIAYFKLRERMARLEVYIEYFRDKRQKIKKEKRQKAPKEL